MLKLRTILVSSVLLVAPAAAFAAGDDDAGDSDHTGAKTGHDGDADHAGANPQAKQLPANASDTAKKNAFGQQGARMKAAHAAAQAAAAKEANDEADQDGAGGPNHHANHHAHGQGADASHGQGAGASHGQGASHSQGHGRP